jgi:hypothetical protein
LNEAKIQAKIFTSVTIFLNIALASPFPARKWTFYETFSLDFMNEAISH